MENFEISTASTEAVYPKLSIKNVLFEKLKGIDFKQFTTAFERLYVVFQCFPPGTKSRKVEEYKVMRRNAPVLELYLVLDYEKVLQGTDNDNLAYMIDVLIKGCEKYLKSLNDFDWPAFETALRQRLF